MKIVDVTAMVTEIVMDMVVTRKFKIASRKCGNTKDQVLLNSLILMLKFYRLNFLNLSIVLQRN